MIRYKCYGLQPLAKALTSTIFLWNYTVFQAASQMWCQYKTTIPTVISPVVYSINFGKKTYYEVKVLMLFDFAQGKITAVKLWHKLIMVCYFKYFQMLILGGTCRLISEIESGDRFVKRTRVVPFNVQQNAQRLPQVQRANRDPNPHPNPRQPSTATAASSSKVQHNNTNDDSEDGSSKTTARKNWAKVNPKYNPVFSLLD